MPEASRVPVAADPVEAVRRFNRFYTARIGVLGAGHLESPYSLTEVRLLYEVQGRGRATSADLARALEADPAQVSRAVSRLVRLGMVTRTRSTDDGRAQVLAVTGKGRRVFRELDGRARRRVGALLAPTSPADRARTLSAMRTIEDVLSGASRQAPFVVIRAHRPGDMGWIIERHGSLYAEEYGWDVTFEALVAGVAKAFLDRHDPAVESCWIAEVDGQRVGSVCLVRQSATVAKLRLLIVDPAARGMRVGTSLVAECIRFARRSGYRRITLWTWQELAAARRIYEHAGFVLVKTAPPEGAFGQTLVFETWELALGPPR
jgi:DNA-binding MarR family transcriptional regulator/GNAT superfamily N-acetyltransferase